MKQFSQDLGQDLSPYQIKVQGRLDEKWSDWFNGMTITFESESDGLPTTTLTGTVDQAALHGTLSRIRDLNLRLISVNPIEPRNNVTDNSLTDSGGERNG